MLQRAFLENYPLENATDFEVCETGVDEIEAGTLIGSLLREVAQ